MNIKHITIEVPIYTLDLVERFCETNEIDCVLVGLEPARGSETSRRARLALTHTNFSELRTLRHIVADVKGTYEKLCADLGL